MWPPLGPSPTRPAFAAMALAVRVGRVRFLPFFQFRSRIMPAVDVDRDVQLVTLRSALVRTIARNHQMQIQSACEVRSSDLSHLMAAQLLDGVQLTLDVESLPHSGAMSIVLTADEADNLARILDHLVSTIRGQEVAPLVARPIGFQG
ncbi:hypothetical protein A6X21_09055 [Planctopirus hydrillae]|uniref:Uncharacterized protein n=2 Tax=Planctopirus hydrillae TaxID=1841610 RepID=A0A1C3E7L1_9PLAN|nr:hypothetical protein A6X21_09055 [Planctopirus hydrillae]